MWDLFITRISWALLINVQHINFCISTCIFKESKTFCSLSCFFSLSDFLKYIFHKKNVWDQFLYIHIFIYMYIELNFEPELYLQQFFKILKPLTVKWQLLYKKQTSKKSKVIFVVSSQEYMYIQWRIISEQTDLFITVKSMLLTASSNIVGLLFVFSLCVSVDCVCEHPADGSRAVWNISFLFCKCW